MTLLMNTTFVWIKLFVFDRIKSGVLYLYLKPVVDPIFNFRLNCNNVADYSDSKDLICDLIVAFPKVLSLVPSHWLKCSFPSTRFSFDTLVYIHV